jgi:S1-C subfamily serine protease
VKKVRTATVFLTVKVTAKDTGTAVQREGTGFVISPSGFLLTAKHLIAKGADTDSVDIAGAIADRYAPGSKLTVIQDNNFDLALLKFSDTSKTYDALLRGSIADVAIGTTLCAVGFPSGQDIFLATGAMSGTGGEHGFWLTNMASNPGDSGAPVFLESGGVVAVKVGGYQGVQNINLIVPLNFASDLLGFVPDLLAASPILGPVQKYRPIDPTNPTSNSMNVIVERSPTGGNQYHFRITFTVPQPPAPPPGVPVTPYPFNLVTIYGWQIANGRRTDLPPGTVNSVPGNWSSGNRVKVEFDLPQQFADSALGWDLRFCVGSTAMCVPSPNLLSSSPVN